MLSVTLKIEDVKAAEGRFALFVGNHGFPMQIEKIKEAASNIRHENISQEALYYICAMKIWERAKQLGITPKDMTLTQLRNAIETAVEI